MVDFSKLIRQREETEEFRREHKAVTIVADEASTLTQFLDQSGQRKVQEAITRALARSGADTLLVAADTPVLKYACDKAKAMGMRTISVEPGPAFADNMSDEQRREIDKTRGFADETVTLEANQDPYRYIAERVSSAACFTAGTKGVVSEFVNTVGLASLGREEPETYVTDVSQLSLSSEDADGKRGVTVAVTGHRPDKLFGYDTSDPRYDMLRKNLSEKFEELGATRLVTGMALGFDQLAFEVAKERGMDVTAAVPVEGQERTWPKASQERYRELLSQADAKVVVSPGPYTPQAMQTRNEWMVDHADTVVACWDGSSGGTANCVRYAKSQGKPMDTIRPQDVARGYDRERIAAGDDELAKALSITSDPNRKVASLVSAPARQMFGYDTSNAEYEACKRWLADELDQCKADTLVMSVESGMPMVAAELAIERGMTLVMAEPADDIGQRWPQQSRSNLWRLRNAAAANPHICDGAYGSDKVRNTQAWAARNSDVCLVIGPDTRKLMRGPAHAAIVEPDTEVVAASAKDVVAAWREPDKAPTKTTERSQPDLKPIDQILAGLETKSDQKTPGE